ncbi:MAG: permease [Chitinophagales bacterium]
MNALLTAATTAFAQVRLTLVHNWPLLALGTLISAATKVYLDQEKLAGFLRRHQGRGVFAATGVAVATPLCSCGTMAVILGMMASRMPWAPVVAFMVSSPLTSPEELAYSGAIFGWPFAWTYFAASAGLGLLGGSRPTCWSRPGGSAARPGWRRRPGGPGRRPAPSGCSTRRPPPPAARRESPPPARTGGRRS